MNQDPQLPTVIFLHILKTGGTTLNVLLENYYPVNRSFSTFATRQHPEGGLDAFRALSPIQKKHIDLLNGHMGFGLHEELPRRAVYITILRDPIERVLSHYFHAQREPDNPVYDLLQTKQMDLPEFVRYYAMAEMDNLQTRMIAGNWDKKGFGPCTEPMIAQAKENLQTHFAVIGLTERFDESYLLMKQAFGWHRTRYEKYQVTKNRPKQLTIPLSHLEVIKQYNLFDLQLYDHAQTLFAEQVKSAGTFFPTKLKAYQLSNWTGHTYWQLRQKSLRMYLRQTLKKRA